MSKDKAKVITDGIQRPLQCGFCAVGNHFGSNNTSPSGVPLPACKHIFVSYSPRRIDIECMCPCTETERGFREMLRAAGKLPTVNASPRHALPIPDLQRPATMDVEPPNDADPTGDHDAVMTPSIGRGGRAERGDLERLVWEVCVAGLSDPRIVTGGDGMTPKWVAFEITMRTRMAYSPSVGAIASVFTRWATVMTATIAEKPLRLTGMTPALLAKYPMRQS